MARIVHFSSLGAGLEILCIPHFPLQAKIADPVSQFFLTKEAFCYLIKVKILSPTFNSFLGVRYGEKPQDVPAYLLTGCYSFCREHEISSISIKPNPS
jgi:hypothetical protein